MPYALLCGTYGGYYSPPCYEINHTGQNACIGMAFDTRFFHSNSITAADLKCYFMHIPWHYLTVTEYFKDAIFINLQAICTDVKISYYCAWHTSNILYNLL